MCHHWEVDRLEEREAELAHDVDEESAAESPDAENVGEQDDERERIEVPPADD